MGYLTETEINTLKQNPYVADADERNIFYTPRFKRFFMENYISGKKPQKIFQEAGFDKDILGAKRIERAAARWKELYAAGGMEALCGDSENRVHHSNIGRLKEDNRELSEKLKECETKIEEERSETLKRDGEIIELQRKIINLYMENEKLREKLALMETM